MSIIRPCVNRNGHPKSEEVDQRTSIVPLCSYIGRLPSSLPFLPMVHHVSHCVLWCSSSLGAFVSVVVFVMAPCKRRYGVLTVNTGHCFFANESSQHPYVRRVVSHADLSHPSFVGKVRAGIARVLQIILENEGKHGPSPMSRSSKGEENNSSHRQPSPENENRYNLSHHESCSKIRHEDDSSRGSHDEAMRGWEN